MSTVNLKSQRYEIGDALEAIETCYEKGWTDGLPVVPPTAKNIQEMLRAAGLKPDEEITVIPSRQARVTAEKAAINAVMAGCKPEYMPVVAAALEAIGDPLYNYHGPATSTGGSAVFMLVNGPIAEELGINSGDNLFGPGWRANATIGRAVRLVMRNVIGTKPGHLDRSTLGHAGKYTYCIAENEKESPWPPLHVERGFKPGQSTVTVFAALAPHQFYNHLSNTPEGVMTTACAHMRISAGASRKPQYVLVISGEHMDVIAGKGWSKDDIRRFCFDHTRSSVAELKRIGLLPGEAGGQDDATLVPLVERPEDFLVVAAGSRAGAFSAFIPGWGGKKGSQSVTREIRLR